MNKSLLKSFSFEQEFMDEKSYQEPQRQTVLGNFLFGLFF